MDLRRTDDQAPVPAGDEHFSGAVAMTGLFEATGVGTLNAALVRFAAGARTDWHSHPDGQVLLVLEGRGRTQLVGGPLTPIAAGDAIHVGAGEQHWHGADPDAAMAHLSVTGPGGTVWDGPSVTDAEYDPPA